MINENGYQPEDLIKNRLVKPAYSDYSFANIAPTIYYLLTRKRIGGLLPTDCFIDNKYPSPKKVVLFLIDSFGYCFWKENINQFKYLKTISKQGIVTPISALFPSTTAAAIATINLGVMPSQHGLFEWNLYIREYDRVIQTLLFSPLGSKNNDELAKNCDPANLVVSHRTIFQRLAINKIRSHQLVPDIFSDSITNRIFAKGAQTTPYANLKTGLKILKNILANDDKAYIYFYYGDIDVVAHHHGPGTKKHKAQIARFWRALEEELSNVKKKHDVLFLFTADHGQIYADPEKTYYLNLQLPQISQYLKMNHQGEIIYPCGSPRDVFLHVKKEYVDDALKLLRKNLKNKAATLSIKEALALNLFGNPPYNQEFLDRLGQILILPYKGNYIWWYKKGKLESKHYGHHGGLTKEEMMTVIASY